MFKRNDVKSKSSRRRDRAERSLRKRRVMMEGLEERRLLASIGTPSGITLPTFNGPRNIGTVQAEVFVESEVTNQRGRNDSLFTSDFINLGTGPGQSDTIDVIGNVGFVTSSTIPPTFEVDIDTFSFDLRGGDILDIATQGAAGNYTVYNPDGTVWYGVDNNQAFGYPIDSPLQTEGNSAFAQVIPEDGRYYVQLSPVTTSSAYTMGLRVYRPSIESTPIGTQQILYVDFDGGIFPRAIFSGTPAPGVARIPGLRESLPLLGIQPLDDAAFNRLIDLTIAETKRMFAELGVSGTNGDFESTGNPGDFGIKVLNSRDHPDPGLSDPLVTRILVGGTVDDAEIQTIGISSTLDIGNFSMDDIVLGLLDGVLGVVGGVPIAPTSSIVDAMGDFLAFLVAHEAGHSFGMRHTAGLNSPQPFPLNFTTNIMDEGPTSDFGQVIGAGPDGIFGTIDDEDVNFVTDIFSYLEGLEGFNQTGRSLSQTLASGTLGGGITGRVFADANANGDGTGDLGIGGVTVFADINNNGVRDATEPSTVTGPNGNYSLVATPGSYTVVALAPPQTTPTTPSAVPVTITTNSTATINFGFTDIVGGGINVTGFVFSDNNGNGTRDAGEAGVGGVYHYLDLDGDNRPDLGEPSAISESDGSYKIKFPGPGTYVIREVVPAGFTQTFPASGEHIVTFNGVLTQNFNFGLLPSRDFGDAPNSYGTTIAANGASHGITAGLSIGAVVDRELDGRPTTAANGDDINGRVLTSGAIEDDEDGVTLLQPLGPGARADMRVTVTNTSGTVAYLQGFMDFNGDGDFTDAGEKFLSDILVPNGVTGLELDGDNGIFVNVPANAKVGTTYARFRLSQQRGVGPTGPINSGEVEDYAFPILGAAQIANDDNFSVSRNSQANQLDVLRNDFETVDNQLTIQNLNVNGTNGIAILSNDRRSVFYTPPNGFIGRDVFSYSVVDEFGNTATANVVVNVTFQSNVPIALDDSFQLPQGSVNRPLNVLDNDIPSTAGGLSIISVTPGTAGGNISIVGGGQSLRYTPQPGFDGTEQFTYSIQDSLGVTSSAEVTINLLPGSRTDDIVEFDIELFDAVNQQQAISNVQVGDEFLVRVSVEHIELFANPEGVASAFLDLLYTDELVAPLNTGVNPDFPFDITFGPLFSGINTLQRGSSQIPGLIDEVGGVQRIDDLQEHAGPTELFTIRMQALSPGVALFTGDPADNNISETVTLGSDTALTVSELRLGSAELLIVPDSENFTAAIDDSFPDGRDSDGNLITSSSPLRNTLDVLANDNLGPTGLIREFGLVTNPTLGNVLVDDNGTPGNLNDDFLTYSANVNTSGLEQFTYFIVTDDGVRSTAKVTFPLGSATANADVAITYDLVDQNGQPIVNNQVRVGDRVGVQVIVEDIRANPTFVFAGYLDMMYDTGILQPADTDQTDRFNFDVEFGPGYVRSAGVGTAARPGIIDEFGTLFERTTFPEDDFDELNPGLLATVFFDVVAPGQARVVGGPADSSPFQDTLLFREDDPVPVSRIRYDVLNITAVPAGPSQNSTLPQDVNDDGFVTPIDALLVINEMSRVAPAFEGESPSLTAKRYFTDVNGDTRTSALDALQVINYLTVQSNQTSGEGELIAPSAPTGTDLQSSGGSDAAFADLSDSDLVGDSAAAANQPVSSPAVVTPVEASDDDDDDDVLALLADDVAGIWS